MTTTNDIKHFLDGLIAQTKPDSPAWNQEVRLGHIKPAWNYIDGCMIKAVLEMHAITGQASYFDFADRFIDYYIGDDGVIKGYKPEDYNSDNINEGKVLFELVEKTGKQKYRKAMDSLRAQLQTHPRTATGNFWHKKIYPNQVWLDGLYMTLPFLAEYEARYNAGLGCIDVIDQFQHVYLLMRDRTTGLLYHGYDETRECFWADKTTGCSKNFWTRSLGWYTMALVDTIEKLPPAFATDQNMLKRRLRDIVDALLKVADPATGMFYQVTAMGGREGNYLETSGTCAIAYSIMKGVRLGYLPADYFAKGERILEAVMKHKLVRNGDEFVLKDICLVAGLGVYPGRGNYQPRDGSYEYYISEPVVDNDAKGVAPFLLAFTELYRKRG